MMEIITGIFYFFLILLGLKYIPFFKNIKGVSFNLLVLFFSLKVLAGTSLIYIYTYFYDLSIADFNKYFTDGKIMFGALKANPVDYLRMLTGIGAGASHLEVYYNEMTSWYRPWETPVYNDSRLIVRFNALVFLLSFGSIHVHTIVMNFLSITGLVAIYRFFLKYTPDNKVFWLPWGIFLFPSLLFWGSGILKEGLLIMAFGFWVYITDKFITSATFSARLIISFIVAGFILVLLKPYNLLFLIPCQVAFYLGIQSKLPAKQFIYFLVLSLWVGAGVIWSYLVPEYDAFYLIARKQNDFVNFSLLSEAGSLIHTRYVKPDLFDMLLFFPRGLWYVLTRPHIFESASPVVIMAALENIMVAGLFFYGLIRFDKANLNNSIVWISFWFAILLMGFVGLVTPLHGAFVRYKILALPFLWVIFVNLTRLPSEEELPRKFSS
jgi:hypothetical protein